MITYGDGSVFYEGASKGFEIKYTGTIHILTKPDNLFIVANRNTIKGVMLDKSNLPATLFEYVGDLRIKYASTDQYGIMSKEKLQLQGVDFWRLDDQKWEDDNSLWGSDNGTYLVGSPQRYNKHSIVVNNNLKTQYKGQFYYEDGSAVNANELIHIHADGIVMTGGVHTEDSVILKNQPDDKVSQAQPIATEQQATEQIYTTGSGSSGSSSSSGGGY